jgi:hypothetical protein
MLVRSSSVSLPSFFRIESGILANEGLQFDPVVVQTFVEIAKEEAAGVFAATGVDP